MRLVRPIINLLVFWYWHCQLTGALHLHQPQPSLQQQSQQQQVSQQQAQAQQQQQQAAAAAAAQSQLSQPPWHQPRIQLRYQSKYPFVSIDERTPNNTVVAAVVVNDGDSGPNGEPSLSIEHGNELGHFKLVSTQFTNTIQVNGAPLSKHRVPEYNLTIVARDHGSPPKSSAVNLVIKLNTSSPPLGINAPLEPQPSLKPPVTDLMYVGTTLVAIFVALIILTIIGCALVQRPKNKKGPPPRAPPSATSSRMHPNEHCPYLGLANLNKSQRM